MTHILTEEDRYKRRRKFWTKRRIRAALAAVAAMLARPEDWGPDVTEDDLEGAMDRLRADLERKVTAEHAEWHGRRNVAGCRICNDRITEDKPSK